MLALVWLLYTAFGMVSRSISPLITPIIRDLNLSYSQMGLILGSWQLTYIVVAVFAGNLIDRWGIRKSLSWGVIFIGLSAALRYFSRGFATFLPMIALFGVGGPMISIGAPKTISIWFSGRSRATAVGIYTTGSWLGGFVALAATNSLIMPLAQNSWRLTFVFYGVMTFAIGLLWWSLARDVKPIETEESSSLRVTITRFIGVTNIRIILILGLLSFAISHGFTNWLPKILEGSGLTAKSAGLMASLPTLCGIPAALSIPRLVSPAKRSRFIIVFALAISLALWLAMNTSGTILILGLLLFGIANSSLFPLTTLVLMELPEVGSRYMGSVGGMFFCVAEVGGFLGPLVMGTLADLTHTFFSGTIFLMSLSLAIAIMASRLSVRE
ncbi:MAG: MFS transporter [Chloroflexota bacterium]